MPSDSPGANVARDQIIFSVLDEISRHRPLTAPESELMEIAIHRLGLMREKWHWTPWEDEMIVRLLKRRAERRWKRRERPARAAHEVRELAEELGRSYWAVQRRLERIRTGKVKPQIMFKRANGHAALDS